MDSIKLFNNLPNDAKNIRIEVFINEQGFKNEFDDTDKIAKHIVYYIDEEPVATARFFTQYDNKEYHIGRIAVKKEYRKCHIGSKLMNFAEQEIIKLGGEKIVLSSQTRAKNFYKSCGFTEIGDEYLDEFCPHIQMCKSLIKL